MATTGILLALQEAAAVFLRTGDAPSRAYFTEHPLPIGIFTEQLATLQDEINKGLRRTGISVLVKTVTANKSLNHIPGKECYGDTVLAFLVGSTPNANPSGLHVLTVASKIVWVMKRFKFNGVAPSHEGTDLLKTQIKDQVHCSVLFSLENVSSSEEPVRATKAPSLSLSGLVASSAAVAVFDFSSYLGGGCTPNLDGPLVFIPPGGVPGEIPLGIPTPAGWTRSEVGAVLTFTCATTGSGHSASAGAGDVGVDFSDGVTGEATVTITSPDEPSAVLRYTTDGSDPTEENGTTQIYSAPVSVAPGTVVRASATVGGIVSAFSSLTAQ